MNIVTIGAIGKPGEIGEITDVGDMSGLGEIGEYGEIGAVVEIAYLILSHLELTIHMVISTCQFPRRCLPVTRSS